MDIRDEIFKAAAENIKVDLILMAQTEELLKPYDMSKINRPRNKEFEEPTSRISKAIDMLLELGFKHPEDMKKYFPPKFYKDIEIILNEKA